MAESVFWMTAGALVLAVAAILLRALRRSDAADVPAAVFDKQLYRDQLSEIERDLARGVIVEEDAKRLRSEVARRLLAADRSETKAEPRHAGPASPPVMAAIALALAAAFGAYVYLGQPGYGDLPLTKRIADAEALRTARPSQTALEAALPPRPPLENVDPEFLALVEKLREATANRPDDLQGQVLLVRNEANLGNLTAAYQAQERVIALKGAEVTVDDFLRQATLMVQAADGQVSPEADILFQKALARAPENDTALFFIGVANIQVGRYDLGFYIWKTLLDTAPENSRWRNEVRSRMVNLAEVAGARYDPPEEALPGPDAAAVAAAEDMSPEERQAMIRSMVEGLSNRLATNGGTAQEWARLIQALATLGEKTQAQTIWTEAKDIFAGQSAELGFINEAAANAGLAK